jgi:23S rRNA pseudouridine955/2504/2580 synthase
MNGLRKVPGLTYRGALTAEVDESGADQRLDNFLARRLKGIPKSHVYRILRTGQVRVNSKRVDAAYRLRVGDRVRIPPLHAAEPRRERPRARLVEPLATRIVFEDDWIIALNKPANIASHGGSGVSHGVIESMRAERPHLRFLELVHRLDRGTSGLLLLAKKRTALTGLHAQLREGKVDKRYVVLVAGEWRPAQRTVSLPVARRVTASGERRVGVAAGGLDAHTVFRRLASFRGFTLLEAQLKTGRTHQIRVHLAHLKFPIAGDDKYGDFALNRELARSGLKRMFLHAARVEFEHPGSGARLVLEAPLPAELERFAAALTRVSDSEAPADGA